MTNRGKQDIQDFNKSSSIPTSSRGDRAMFYRSRVVLSALSLALGISAVAAGTTYTLTDLGTATGSGNSYGYGLATVNGSTRCWAHRWFNPQLHRRSGYLVGREVHGPAFNRFRRHGRLFLGQWIPAETPWAERRSTANIIRPTCPPAPSATVLPVLNTGTPYGWAYGISNTGIIAGFSTSTDAYGNNHACVWTSAGTITDVGGLAANSSSATMALAAMDLHGRIRIPHQRQPDWRAGWLGAHGVDQYGLGWTCTM